MKTATTAPDEVTARPKAGPLVKLSLFWRTFILLALLIFFSSVAWLQMFKTQEYEPRILRNSHQIATVVNLTKTALKNSDEIARLSLIKMLADEEDVRIQLREPDDQIETFTDSGMDSRLVNEMVKRLGAGTVVASKVNNEEGLWIGHRA